MKLAFVINNVESCMFYDTTISLGMTACNRGHEVYYSTVGDAIYYTNGHIAASAIKLKGKFKDLHEFVAAVKDEKATRTKITTEDLDVLYLRNNPSDDIERSWAKFAGILFGQFAEKQGVLVVNHPDTLAYAHVDKMYFEHFPENIRPASLITRQYDEIEAFYKEHNSKIILKPLEGSGGKDVFLADKKESNLKQIVEAISRSGYVIAQEYMPDAKNGDVRFFMMNGKPMMYKDKYAAFRRVNDKDIRSNMHTGGKAVKAEVTKRMLEICEIMGPKLRQDGIFCAGLDIVGNKLIELNITSPGGLAAASRLENVDFNEYMIMSLENKLRHKKYYGNSIPNKDLAVME